MKIFKVEVSMINPNRAHQLLYGEVEDAMSYFNGVKSNPDCTSIEVTALENREEFSLFETVRLVASYKK